MPLTLLGAEKKEFLDYLNREKMVTFTYEQEKYTIEIEKILIYPQCYAAIVDQLAKYQNQLIIDIGSWTVDIMVVRDGRPIEEESLSLPHGLIPCMRQINGEIVRVTGEEISEHEIQQVIMMGDSNLKEPYLNIVKRQLANYASDVGYTLKELGYNLDTMPITFVGGGASVGLSTLFQTTFLRVFSRYSTGVI